MPTSDSHNKLEHVTQPGEPGAMIEPEAHARQHAQVRKAHESELIEDYVELIADLIEAKGEARAVELAQRMGVTQATVGKMIGRLGERGLVESEPYRSIFLTDQGRAMAETSRERHITVLRFLRHIGVPETHARNDAEGMEHHVSDATLAVMRRMLTSAED